MFASTGRTLRDLFRAVDDDHSFQIDVNELFDAFKAMKMDITQKETEQIFFSVDFDGSGTISMPEFKADF